MSELDSYLALKKEAEECQRAADKAQGEYEANLKRLKDEFGCPSLAQAKRKLLKLKKEEEELTEELKKGIAEYKEKWNDSIDTD
jgi:hypothetical protein